MLNTEETEKFMYWKYPWQKVLVFIAGILNVIGLWLNIQDYKEYQYFDQAGMVERIFGSYSEWESVIAQQGFICTSNGIITALFLGILIIGAFARTERTARISEAVLFMIFALVWVVLAFTAWVSLPYLFKIIWWILFILFLGGSVCTFWKFRRKINRT